MLAEKRSFADCRSMLTGVWKSDWEPYVEYQRYDQIPGTNYYRRKGYSQYIPVGPKMVAEFDLHCWWLGISPSQGLTLRIHNCVHRSGLEWP